MSKPILSELEYNASDVASAILASADLSVTNQDFGVTDITDQITAGTDVTLYTDRTIAFSFNGFVFLSVGGYGPSDIATNDVLLTFSNSYHPSNDYTFTTISHQADSAYVVVAKESDGTFRVIDPINNSGNSFYFGFNGFFRYT